MRLKNWLASSRFIVAIWFFISMGKAYGDPRKAGEIFRSTDAKGNPTFYIGKQGDEILPSFTCGTEPIQKLCAKQGQAVMASVPSWYSIMNVEASVASTAEPWLGKGAVADVFINVRGSPKSLDLRPIIISYRSMPQGSEERSTDAHLFSFQVAVSSAESKVIESAKRMGGLSFRPSSVCFEPRGDLSR